MDGNLYEDELIETLKMVAPGTRLRDGLENILRAKTGGLVVVGDSAEIMEVVEGGFKINCPFSAANIYELAKMDGAIILNREVNKILYANTQLVPDVSIPSTETGIRHRTAERIARQTGELVIAISQRRNIITFYKGILKYTIKDISVILNKANQAVQTLEKYRKVFDRNINDLNSLEFDDLVTIFDVAKVLQRTEMLMRVVIEIEKYTSELGIEGRLIRMQKEELVSNIEEEGLKVIRDYSLLEKDLDPLLIAEKIHEFSSEQLLDLTQFAKILGYKDIGNMDIAILPRGYRLLSKIPRLPQIVIENLVADFENFQEVLDASIQELDDVEGVGEVRSKMIKEGLRRLKEQILLDIHI